MQASSTGTSEYRPGQVLGQARCRDRNLPAVGSLSVTLDSTEYARMTVAVQWRRAHGQAFTSTARNAPGMLDRVSAQCLDSVAGEPAGDWRRTVESRAVTFRSVPDWRRPLPHLRRSSVAANAAVGARAWTGKDSGAQLAGRVIGLGGALPLRRYR